MRQGFEVKIPIKKLDAEQGLATGWASIISDAEGTPIIDSDGDVILFEELEKAVHDAFTKSSGEGKAGDLHQRQGTADIVESMVFNLEKRNALGFGKGPEGWVVTIKIRDPEQRAKVSSGEHSEFSIRGFAKPIPVEKRAGEVVKTDKPKILTDLVLDEFEFLSTVDKGASGDESHRPSIVLYKRKGFGLKVKEAITNFFKSEDSEEEAKKMPIPESVRAKLSEEELAELEAALAAEMSPEEEAKEEGEEKPEEEMKEEPEEEEKSEEEEKAEEGEEEEKAKREAVEKENADLREALSKVRKEADRKDMLAKVQKEFAFVPGIEAEKLAGMLLKARDSFGDDFADFEKLLGGVSEMVQKSAIWKRIGSTGVATGDAAAEVEARAKEHVSKNPNVSLQQARWVVADKDPELKKRWADEVRGVN